MRKLIATLVLVVSTLFHCASVKAQSISATCNYSAVPMYHPTGATSELIFEFTLKNDSSENVKVQQIGVGVSNITLQGLLYDSTTNSIIAAQTLLYGGSIFQIGSQLTIPAHSSKTLLVKANIPLTCQGGHYPISLNSLTGQGVNTLTVYNLSGGPLYGNQISISHPLTYMSVDSVPLHVCQGRSIRPTASYNWNLGISLCNGSLQQEWSFGWDASTQYYTGANPPTITYSNSGYHTIILLLTDTTTGYSDRVNYTFMVDQLPSVYIQTSGAYQLNCLTDTVLLQAYNNNQGAHLNWYYNGSFADSGQNLVVTKPGNYSMQATSMNGCVENIQNYTIYKDSFYIRILSNNSTVPDTAYLCQGSNNSVYMGTYVGSSWVSTYQWNNGNATSWLQTNTPGIYSVTATNNLGCTTTDSITVKTRQATPPVIVADGPTTFCVGSGSVRLHIPSNHYMYTNWSSGVYNDTVAYVSWTNAVTVQITDSFGCQATSAPLQVTALPQPAYPTITPIGCELYSSNADIHTQNVWYVDTVMLPYTTEIIYPTVSGVFTTKVIDQNGCTATSSPLPYQTLPLPVISVNGSVQFCAGGSVLLTVAPGNTFMWSNGDTTESINVTTSGNYTVTVKSGTCTQTASPIQVTVQNCTTGINDIASTNFTIYPNPVTTTLDVANVPENVDKVEVLSMTGQTIYSQMFSHQTSTQLDVSYLSTGMYFLKLQSGKDTIIKKFVKE